MKPGTLMLWQMFVNSEEDESEWGIYIVIGPDPHNNHKTLMIFVSSLTIGVTVRSFQPASVSPQLTVLQTP